MIRVFKFGGASVKDAQNIQNVLAIVKAELAHSKLLLVISAMGKTTNFLEEVWRAYEAEKKDTLEAKIKELEEEIRSVLKDLFPKWQVVQAEIQQSIFARLREFTDEAPSDNSAYHYDQIVSFGELISTFIVATYFKQEKIKVQLLEAQQFIQTDNLYREGQVKIVDSYAQMAQIPAIFEAETDVIITQGFLGGTDIGMTTTLGREGSDYSAALFAAGTNAQSLTIWKDVEGVLNADPRKIAKTSLIEKMSYQQARNLTYRGAKVIHYKTMKPLQEKQIPLFVRSFLNTKNQGTKICHEAGILPPIYIHNPKQQLVSIRLKENKRLKAAHFDEIFSAIEEVQLLIQLSFVSINCFTFSTDNQFFKQSKLSSILGEKYSLERKEAIEMHVFLEMDNESQAKIIGEKSILAEQQIEGQRMLLTAI